MPALLPSIGALLILMFVELLGLALHYLSHAAVFHAESLIAGLFDRRVDDSDGLLKLELVAELIVQVHRGQEEAELRMGMDPPESLHLQVDLGLEELDLICHVAHVLLSLLLGYDQCCDNIGVSALRPTQDCTGLNLILCV